MQPGAHYIIYYGNTGCSCHGYKAGEIIAHHVMFEFYKMFYQFDCCLTENIDYSRKLAGFWNFRAAADNTVCWNGKLAR